MKLFPNVMRGVQFDVWCMYGIVVVDKIMYSEQSSGTLCTEQRHPQ